jgi:hypothetical protein
MKADFVDEAGRQIPAEFEDKGFITRWLNRIKQA